MKKENQMDDAETLNKKYPPNSRVKRIAPIRYDIDEAEETPDEVINKIKPVGRGLRVERKRSIVRSMTETIFGEDTRGAIDYILQDVLIPAAKTTIQEMVSGGLEMLLFGESKSHGRSRSKRYDRTIVSYSSFYNKRDHEEYNAERRRRSSNRFNLDEVTFKRGDEAAEVLEGLCDMLDEYRQATVADFYDLAGIDGGSYVERKWGWESLSRAYVTHTRQGYIIVLPKPKELD